MLNPDIALALAIASAAGLMRGFAGVGSGMLMAPFFVPIFGPVGTVGILTLIEAVVTVQLLPSVWNDIRWRVILPIGAAATLTMPFGSWVLVSVDPATIQIGVALLVVVSALILMTGWRYSGQRPLTADIGVGCMSGFLISTTSIGNPPVIVYLLSGNDSARTNRANFTGYFGLTLAALIVVMSIGGLFTKTIFVNAGALLPAFMLMVWVGSRLFNKANETLYRRIALSILLLAGLYALFQSF
ncbi:MAG: sulfite exporter TauE/SafE family protein [Pseudomonadota bacterium]